VVTVWSRIPAARPVIGGRPRMKRSNLWRSQACAPLHGITQHRADKSSSSA
jgi:hypothetical protein